MRALLVLGVLALLAACNREPDFDERYEAASRQIGTSAKKIDVELEKREKASDIGKSADLSAMAGDK